MVIRLVPYIHDLLLACHATHMYIACTYMKEIFIESCCSNSSILFIVALLDYPVPSAAWLLLGLHKCVERIEF